jgi:Plasmid pRiA4b ORF-3-like protein
MRTIEFSTEHEQILRETTIDADHPGPILHDFEAVCQFVGTEGVRAAGKYNLLPIDAIPSLDERLSRPLRLKLQRPQLKSHPYLQGLHLLLRATGLAIVEGVGDKARLRLDSAMMEKWNGLNQTERFFTLLEAAFLHASGTMIGESSSRDYALFQDCWFAWSTLPKKGKRFDLSQPTRAVFMYRRLYLLAVADLLGLFHVEQPHKSVQPWCPQAVGHTPFGDGFFTVMEKNEAYDVGVRAEDDEPAPFGLWQPILKPYFPEWRKNLELPRTQFREGVYVFKVSLGNVWRRIAIPDSLTLEDLADEILDAVNFDCDHLYEFTFRDQLGRAASINHPGVDEGPFADEYPIGELPLQPGQSMTFLFDFGDNWKFNVKLEKIDPPSPRMKKSRVLEKHGKAPEQYPESDW